MRRVGIPQGSSISLFLANIACWELDRSLERTGVRFSRYADDTLIWSDSYERIVEAYGELRRCGELMQVPINLEKSGGISLLTERPRGEMASKESVEYLGYKLTLTRVSIKPSQVDQLKRRISYIIYQNLLQPLKHGIFNKWQLGALDGDYVVALDQIRRYLYGGLNDEKLRKYIRGQLPHLNFRGLMSYYPVVSDESQLSNLDGWLIYILRQTLKLREKHWIERAGVPLPGPHKGWIDALASLRSWTSPDNGHVFDLRIPSFQLINKAMQIAIMRGGIKAVASPVKIYYG